MLHRIRHAVARWLRRGDHEKDLELELAAYESMLVDEQKAAGVTTDSARRVARLSVGSRDSIKEAVRDVRMGVSLERLLRDVLYAARSLRRSPTYSGFTLLTFGLAIGGLTIILSLVNEVLLKPLPYPNSDRLVALMEKGVDDGARNSGFVVSAPNFLDWERQDTLIQSMGLYEYLSFNLTGEGDPEQVGGLRVTSGLFDAIGIPPMLGRPLLPADDSLANGRVVVLSYRLWQRRYGADSGILGRSIQLNGEAWQVVGVMPSGFAFTSRGQQVFVPIQFNPDDQGRASHSFLAVGRLKDGVSVAEADAELHVIGDRLRQQYPEDNARETATAFPLSSLWVYDVTQTLRVLMVAVLLVLLIAAANVTGLTVARGNARRRELAARLALGGSRWLVLREQIVESLVLALGGAALGLAIAGIGVRELVAIFPQNLRSVPFRDITAVSVDLRVALIVAGVAVLVGLASGLMSSLSVMPANLASVLGDGSSRGATSRRGNRVRSMLVGLEVALAVVVLAGAGLLVASMRKLHQVAPGLQPDGVITLQLALPQKNFYGPAERLTFCDDLRREAGALPGVTAVSAVSHLPFSGANAGRSFIAEGQPLPDPGNQPYADWGVVCPGYLTAVGIPLVAGRDFTAADRDGASPVIIINQKAAEKFFPGNDAVGKRVKLGNPDSDAPWMTIVGVAGDVHHSGLQRDAQPYFYAPYQQSAWPQMTVVVRSARSGSEIGNSVKQTLRRIAPDQPVSDPVFFSEVLDRSLGQVRFPMLLFAGFGLMVLLLAGLGIFGVAMHAVQQRRRELGIRIALGARNGSVLSTVLSQALRPVGLGVVAGLLGARAATQLLTGSLYGVTPGDPLIILTGAAVLGGAALLASLWPAYRATRVDPATVLRSEG